MSTQAQSPFKRIVVLMMENQSFDHLLGWVPGVGTLDAGQHFQMLNGIKYPVGKIADPSRANGFDPHHDFTHVMEQLYGPTPPLNPTLAPTGEWFLSNNCSIDPATFMACYTPEQVPVLTALATSYTTCARWFSSVPGPTGPNRLFAHCATSGGYNGASYSYDNSFNPPMKSIFNLLDDESKTWSIYWDGNFSTAYAIEPLRKSPNFPKSFLALNDFASDVKRLGTELPQYVFITPSLNGGNGYTANSMHPADGGTVADGETLIKTVYEALTSNTDVWNETLLLIVFDEHGGFYDSVMPTTRPPAPPANPFQNWPPEHIDGYDFTNYGVRVPAIVISAWHPQCVDTSTVFEHSSIPKTVEALFGLPNNLGGRDVYELPTFHANWELSTSPAKPIELPEPDTGTKA